GQHAALDALLGPIRGIGAGFFPPPTAPSSGRRPCSTNSSLRLVTRQSVPLPPATALETPLRRPSTESGHERSNGDTTPSHLTPPTDSPSVTRRRWHRRTVGPGHAGGRPQSDARSPAWGVRGARPPRVPQSLGSWRSPCSLLLAAVFVSSVCSLPCDL